MPMIDETGHVEIIAPLCLWCEQPLNGFSKDGMHQKCHEECSAATAEAYDRWAMGWTGTGRKDD
jgi:hypothetical protein